jgi:hypothetical protein
MFESKELKASVGSIVRLAEARAAHRMLAGTHARQDRASHGVTNQ